jgi:uncharacterized repeat protein (TIGR01451 family)
MIKKILFKIAFVLLLFGVSQFTMAQTSVTITSAGDTTWFGSYCGTPDTINFYLNGNSTGYNPLTDSMDVFINFGDGNDTTVTVPIYAQNPPTQFFGVYLSHIYYTSGTYSVQYIATGPDGNADTLVNINELFIGDSCGNVSGKIYGDMNGNCQFDTGTDSLIPYYLVRLMQGSTLVTQQWTDQNGDYFFIVPTGNYTVEVGSQYGFVPACPTNGIVSMNTSVNPVNNLGLTCSNSFDLTATLWGTRFRPGFPGWLYPNFTNLSCQPVSGTVTLTLDPLTSYVSSSITPSSVNGNVITWNFTNIANAYNWYNLNTQPLVTINTSPSAQIGDTVCFTLSISPTTGDANPANNTFTFCSPVRNSWDPNEKHAAPLGKGATGIVTPGTRITYIVHFQNNGNDTAYNVAILDTIDSDFDIQSIDIIGHSHAMAPNYQGNNIVKFNFTNIMLPDSSTNPAGSQGWVSYSIAPKTGLSLGTQVKNTAYIFFDFNYAIITNTTVNTFDVIGTALDAWENSGFNLYPNPASQSFTLETKDKSMIESVRIEDMTGKTVFSGVNLHSGQLISVDNLPSGMYVFKINSNKTQSALPLLIRK